MLERSFDYGQVYVALSRVKSLEGLWLSKPIKPSSIKAHPAVLEFYKRFDPTTAGELLGQGAVEKQEEDDLSSVEISAMPSTTPDITSATDVSVSDGVETSIGTAVEVDMTSSSSGSTVGDVGVAQVKQKRVYTPRAKRST